MRVPKLAIISLPKRDVGLSGIIKSERKLDIFRCVSAGEKKLAYYLSSDTINNTMVGQLAWGGE